MKKRLLSGARPLSVIIIFVLICISEFSVQMIPGHILRRPVSLGSVVHSPGSLTVGGLVVLFLLIFINRRFFLKILVRPFKKTLQKQF